MSDQSQLRTVVLGAEGAMGKRLISSLKATRTLVALDQSAEPWLALDSHGGGSGGCDVTDPDQIKSLIDQIGVPICGVVYLPRVRVRRQFASVQVVELLNEFAVVLGGFISTLQSLADLQSKQPETCLSVVALSSVLGSRISGYEGVGYQASKASLEQTVRVCSRELGPLGIRVNAVAPGWLTDGEESFLDLPDHLQRTLEFIQPLKRPPTYAQLSDLVDFLLSEKSLCLTGQVIFADGGSQSLETSFSAIGGQF